MSVEVMRSVIDAAEGRVPVDTLFTNVQIVDVYGQRVAPGSVAVKDGVIVGVLYDGRDDAAGTYEATEVIDGQGRYIAPGFIDGHLHIESSNIRPAEYARMAATRGTTTAIADSHEIANVAGLDGLRFMIEDGRRAPISIKYMMPSCVPALPDEQAGAVITAEDMHAFFAEHPGDVFGLGEMMNLPGVFMGDPETCARIDAANQTPSKQVDGHAPLVAGKDLNAYAAAGIIADHESTIPEEALDKLSRGMYVMLREGTCSHDLANLSPMQLENPARARRCCFATDDRAPSDALATGMIDNACRVAIEAGIDPVVAISMASLSTAEAFGLDHGCRDPHELRGAIAPGKRADLLVLNDLTFATAPHRVYAAGALVAQDGTFVGEIAPEMAEVAALADELRASVKLPKLSLDVFDYAFKPGEAVIDVVPGKAITGMARPESAEGLRRIMLIERHGRGVSLQAEGADGDGPAGAMRGIASSLSAARLPLVAIVACDMPFVSPKLIDALAHRVDADALDVCVPREERGIEPLCAVWRRQACAPVARELLDQDRQRIRCLIDRVHAGYLDEPQIIEAAGSTLCFENVNTPEEFAAAELLA